MVPSDIAAVAKSFGGSLPGLVVLTNASEQEFELAAALTRHQGVIVCCGYVLAVHNLIDYAQLTGVCRCQRDRFKKIGWPTRELLSRELSVVASRFASAADFEAVLGAHAFCC